MSIRVATIDDSDIVLRRLDAIFRASDDIRVVRALRGLLGVDLARELGSADVALVDMLMPGRSGLSALEELVRVCPVIVVSDEAAGSDVAREALARGARAFVSKRDLGTPSGEEALRSIVRSVAGRDRISATAPPPSVPVLVLAGSTGAHRALEMIGPSLAGLEGLACVVLQHMHERGDAHFAEWLSGLGMPASLARDGDPLVPGACLVAPAGTQTILERPGRVRLAAAEPTDLHAPSADRLLRSASFLGARLTVVVLSGLGSDGSKAIAELVRAGATCLVQDPEDCVAPPMPRAALAASRQVRRARLANLPTELRRALRR